MNHFYQHKLTRTEWESIEKRVSIDELAILQMIQNGADDVNISYQTVKTCIDHLKIAQSPAIDMHIYETFFKPTICAACKKHSLEQESLAVKKKGAITMRKADAMKIANFTLAIDQVLETILLNHIDAMCNYYAKQNVAWMVELYVLYRLNSLCTKNINAYVLEFVNHCTSIYTARVDWRVMFRMSPKCVEGMNDAAKYSMRRLYSHQADMFNIFGDLTNHDTPKLVFYIAATSTGKTLTPIGLVKKWKIIYVCASRHVGIALARNAISVGCKVAFAFGCKTASDVRLHNNAVGFGGETIRHHKNGRILKVDNSMGQNVEMIICDITSYLCAMNYMLAFNDARDTITFMDEPTITLDQSEHELHEIIRNNWTQNMIPNVVLCSATLPKLSEIPQVGEYFQTKFSGAQIHTVESHNYHKSIPVIDPDGFVAMPHYVATDLTDLRSMATHLSENRTLLRYIDIAETVKFVDWLLIEDLCECKFDNMSCVSMEHVKDVYLHIIMGMTEDCWSTISRKYAILREKRICSLAPLIRKGASIDSATVANKPIERLPSQSKESVMGAASIYITTRDAHTLTEAPTLYLCNDVRKIAQFCIQNAAIPSFLTKQIERQIESNNAVNKRMSVLEQELEDMTSFVSAGETGTKKDKKEESNKMSRVNEDGDEICNNNGKLLNCRAEIDQLQAQIQPMNIPAIYVPNSPAHIEKWAPNAVFADGERPFCSDLDNNAIVSLMSLNSIDDVLKILLMLGTGTFMTLKHNDNPSVMRDQIAYNDLMKRLADAQKLYLNIASSDFIYGMNYQYAHMYLGKDLFDVLTQEKLTQALGRVGRGNMAMYSVRLRDVSLVRLLFCPQTPDQKPEVVNMRRLFGM